MRWVTYFFGFLLMLSVGAVCYLWGRNSQPIPEIMSVDSDVGAKIPQATRTGESAATSSARPPWRSANDKGASAANPPDAQTNVNPIADSRDAGMARSATIPASSQKGAPATSLPTAPAAGAPADPLPAGDQVLVRFDQGKVDDVRLRHRFGVFREIRDPKSFQWIQESQAPNALRIHYEVPGAGSFNGWWYRFPHGTDWTARADGDLILRLACEKPCTTELKLELKTNQGKVIHPYIANITAEHIQQQEKSGFFDLVIPIQQIVYGASLAEMHELVIVFENSRVSETKGDLLLHSIRTSESEPADQ